MSCLFQLRSEKMHEGGMLKAQLTKKKRKMNLVGPVRVPKFLE
jgi:hypothetical protein